MEENRLNYEKENMRPEFTLLPMNEWDKLGDTPENSAVTAISQIKQKYRDSVFLEIYESDRILHAELANRISLSASGLNAVIKKMNDGTVKTIREIKAGKFKFYTLTREGIEYVETMILPSLMVNGQDAEEVHNLLHLLALYKDKNPDIWIEKLTELSEEESVESESDEDTVNALGYELLKGFGQFYRREADKALKLLELSIPNKEMQQKLMLYFQEKYDKGNTTPWEILEQWEQHDCRGVYRMLDDLFISIVNEKYVMKKSSYMFPNVGTGFEIVMDKIKADVLHAMFCQWTKSKLIDLWLEEKLNVHLAEYIAEKFRTLSELFVEKIRNQEKNSDAE